MLTGDYPHGTQLRTLTRAAKDLESAVDRVLLAMNALPDVHPPLRSAALDMLPQAVAMAFGLAADEVERFDTWTAHSEDTTDD